MWGAGVKFAPLARVWTSGRHSWSTAAPCEYSHFLFGYLTVLQKHDGRAQVSADKSTSRRNRMTSASTVLFPVDVIAHFGLPPFKQEQEGKWRLFQGRTKWAADLKRKDKLGLFDLVWKTNCEVLTPLIVFCRLKWLLFKQTRNSSSLRGWMTGPCFVNTGHHKKNKTGNIHLFLIGKRNKWV